MANLIHNPTYYTFKNAVLNGYMGNSSISAMDVCKSYKVTPLIASAWLSRMEKERQEEIALIRMESDVNVRFF